MPPSPSTLLNIERFNGLETFLVTKPRCRIWRDEEAGLTRAVFELSAKKAVAKLPDTEGRGRPTWAIEWSGKAKLEKVLAAGARLRVPQGYDDDTDTYLTAFHYFDDDTSEKNLIEIVRVEGKKVTATLTGRATDANFYDGGKPAMRLETTATFTWSHSLTNGVMG